MAVISRAALTGLLALLALPAAAQEPKREKVEVPGTPFSFELVQVPGGKISVGTPAREVELKAFWVGRLEVTWELWAAYFSDRRQTKLDGLTRPSPPYEPPNGKMGVGDHPAVGMRWHGAVGFCEWLSKVTGERFRLPTETEWEYAARAGETGDGPAAPDDVAWHKGNSGLKTHPVGTKKPNAFGLGDTSGNVWEYALEPMSPPDFGPVLRGGSWNTPADQLKFGQRQAILPDWYERDPNRPRSMWWLTDGTFVGFRIVRCSDPADKAAAQEASSKIEITGLKLGATAQGNQRVTGTVKNGSGRSLDEIEVMIYFVDGDGKPVLEDNKARPGFTKAYPVLVTSYHPGPQAQPLAAGASREFAVDCPIPYDLDDEAKNVGAKPTSIRFSK